MVELPAYDATRTGQPSEPLVKLVVKADVDAGTITVAGEELDRYEVTGLIAELAHALAAIAPPPDPGWHRDPNREDLSGRIGQKRAARRT